MQPWIEELGTRMPALEVAAVFVDVDDANRGWAELLIGSAGDGDGDEYYPLVPFSGFPYPLDMENEHWRAGLPVLPGQPETCPFARPQHPSSGEEPDFPDFPDIPGLDFTAWEPIPDPDLGRLFDSFKRSASSKGSYDIRGEKDWETDQKPDAILKRYRDELSHPSWDIQGESRENPVAWLIWTVRDSEGNLWFGSLIAAPAGRGRVQVWTSLYSDDLR